MRILQVSHYTRHRSSLPTLSPFIRAVCFLRVSLSTLKAVGVFLFIYSSKREFKKVTEKLKNTRENLNKSCCSAGGFFVYCSFKENKTAYILICICQCTVRGGIGFYTFFNSFMFKGTMPQQTVFLIHA
jgi:hypothetical protein